MIFIDGENIVMRFQEMCKIYKVCDHNYPDNAKHEKDVYLWYSHMVPDIGLHEIVRCTLYTYVQGSDCDRDRIESDIKKLKFWRHGNSTLPNTITPKIFIKRKGMKAKGVDISISVDALSHAAKDHYDTAVILSGDGDYLRLIDEIQSFGKQCYVGSFSEGCHPRMKIVPDMYFSLDDFLFSGVKTKL